jgi:hypothetical protein
MTPESQAVSRSFVIDSTDPRELAIFASACVLAKHLAYAFGDAYFTIPTTTTPVSLWLATNPVGKDVWIRHAMEWLRSQDPIQQGPIFVTGLRGKVIGQISPAPAAPRVRENAARPPAGEQRALQHESRSPDGDGLQMVKGLQGSDAGLLLSPSQLTAAEDLPLAIEPRVHARVGSEEHGRTSVKEAAGSNPADSLFLRTEAPPTLCIYCTDRAIDPAHDPYCSPLCALHAEKD